jgi:hypothetical protein
VPSFLSGICAGASNLQAEIKVQGMKIAAKGEEEEAQKVSLKNGAKKKIEPGRSAEGPRDPGLSCPPPQ